MITSAISLTLHAANRFFQRDVPIEALYLLPLATPLLSEKPLKLKFKNTGITMVARMAEDGRPRLISAWHQIGGKK